MAKQQEHMQPKQKKQTLREQAKRPDSIGSFIVTLLLAIIFMLIILR